MPRLHGIREVRFVPVGWTDERGYKVEVVTDPIVIDHYKERFERATIKARDAVKLCAEVGHHAHCGGMRKDGEAQCAFWLRQINEICWTADRHQLVRIDIPL